MKRVIAFITVLVFAICTCAVVSFSEGNYNYSLDATNKQIDQGETATLRLELTKDGSSFAYCGVNATVAVPFDISTVTYTVPGKSAVSVTPKKLDPEAETSSSNPYTFTIDYAPEFSVEDGPADTASGNISISFKIGDDVATGYKNITVTSIRVYIDKSVEDNTSSEGTSSEDVSSEEISSEETSSEETSSEETSSETSQETVLEVYNAGHAKTEVDITPKSATSTSGDGATLAVKILDKNAKNTKLTNLKILIDDDTKAVLSPAFSSDVATYSVTVDAEVTSATIVPKTIYSAASISYQADNGATVTSEGVVTLGSGNTQRITVTVTSGQYKQNYYVNINRKTSSEVSSDISSDTSSEVSSDPSSDPEDLPGIVSNGASSDVQPSNEPSSDVSSTIADPAISNGNENGISTGVLILIIIVSFACGFILCLILVKSGAIHSGDNGNKPNATVNRVETNSDFTLGASSVDSGSGYTATRVMPIPGGNNKKFEINIEYDEPAEKKAETPQKEGTKPEKEVKQEKETKPKKQSFFFDDDEF